jgi:hypothetical protein
MAVSYMSASAKPALLPLNAAGISPDLRAVRAWVGWKWKLERKGRWTKIPVNVKTGRLAKTDDDKTWSDFDMALQNYKRVGCDGIGLCRTGDLVFIDCDGVFDGNGDLLAFPWVEKILSALRGRVHLEKSVTGTGFHGIGRGTLPPGRRQFDDPTRTHTGYGFYDRHRLFTFSGNILPGSAEICDVTAELVDLHRELFPVATTNHVASTRRTVRASPAAALSDAELIERARRAKDGPTFSRLFDGDHSSYPSQSEADLALCTKLSFWCGNDGFRIDALFRRSGLMRKKWERTDYRDRTIEKAIAKTIKVFSPATRETPGMAADNPPEPRAVVKQESKSVRSSAWRDLLIRNTTKEKGKLVPGAPKAILANAITALRCAPEWDGVLAYNEFSLYTVTKRKAPWQNSGGGNWKDFDDSRTAEWLQHMGILVSSKLAAEAAQTVAMENTFHPVRDYLAGLAWDGKRRLDTWLVDYLAVSDSSYVRAVGARWVISAVARVHQPGCQADYTLLLEGDQGIRKSTALRTLAGDQWFTDHISDISSKDARIELHGVWIMELAELAKIRTTASEKVKSFLTARVDHFRQPYGRRSEYVPRQCVFAASVNDSTPFTDETGNRRFWPARCGNDIQVDALAEARDQLWAEAYRRYLDGAIWYLDTHELNRAAEDEQEQRYASGVWDDVILSWLDNPVQRMDNRAQPIEPFDSTYEMVTVTDILIHAIGKQLDKFDQKDLNQVSRCLIHHRWRRRRAGPRGARKYFYQRPPEGS